MARIPARCNRRACQARRNLSKRPEQYVRAPKCHVAGCDGLMYVDEYRLRRGPHDRAPACTDPLCQWAPSNPKRWKEVFHRVDNVGCSGYESWALDRSLAASKHSPRRAETGEAPF